MNEQHRRMKQLYLYEEKENSIKLYFGETSTLEGLNALEKKSKIKIVAFGATLYKNYGWASEKELPNFNQVEELIEFLKNEGDIGLIDFELEIVGKGKMTSHDDGECKFILNDKKYGIGILKRLTPENQSDFIIGTLLKNKGIYVTVDSENNVQKFSSFDEFIKQDKRN